MNGKTRILRLSIHLRPLTKPTGNDGASHAGPNAEVPETESEREEELGAKKIRQPRHFLKYVVVKRWITGERAEMDEDRIRSELEAEMRAFDGAPRTANVFWPQNTSNRHRVLEARAQPHGEMRHPI